MTELETKLAIIRNLLDQHSLDAFLLQRVDNFAWATCGAASYVNMAVADGLASLLVTRSGRYVITDNIEAQGWEFRITPWFERNEAVADLTRGLKFGADVPYPGATDLSSLFPRLRAALTAEEGQRFRLLGSACAAAMDGAIRSICPGMTEHEIAGRLGAEAERRGVLPIVNLVGTDERIFHIRHPLPTDKRMERYAMLVLCGRKQGLVCSITRLVHFGRLPDELRAKAMAVAEVDACFIAATRPGRKLCDIFNEAGRAYASAGYADQWRLHHQGGLAGYTPREIVATPYTEDEVSIGQVYAWNPSIAGTKSEDTILVGQEENEILTAIPRWPAIQVELNGRLFERPGILEIE